MMNHQPHPTIKSYVAFGLIIAVLELIMGSGCISYYDLASVTHSSTDAPKHRVTPSYTPSPVEKYTIDNGVSLGYNAKNRGEMKPTCNLWNDPTLPFHGNLSVYLEELSNYTRMINEFKPIPNLRLALQDKDHDICDTVKLNSKGLAAIFPSQQLSFGSSFGGIEPLLPPMRHPSFCTNKRKHLMNMDYMIHDFGAMCRQLKSTSRIILVDMGASLDFHGKNQPAIYLTDMYHKFGLPFDHIYAFEITPKEPADVYKALPENLLASYHWINIGVESDPRSRLNPLKMVLEKYNSDDFIVVKLDIDMPSIEVPLAMQLLEDERYGHLIDQFYFEEHVFIKELARKWGSSMSGTLLDSLKLFSGLREKGIAAHSWV